MRGSLPGASYSLKPRGQVDKGAREQGDKGTRRTILHSVRYSPIVFFLLAIHQQCRMRVSCPSSGREQCTGRLASHNLEEEPDSGRQPESGGRWRSGSRTRAAWQKSSSWTRAASRSRAGDGGRVAGLLLLFSCFLIETPAVVTRGSSPRLGDNGQVKMCLRETLP